MKQKNKENGITIISLVVTIIIMLILASVTITTLYGDGGVINNTKNYVGGLNETLEQGLDEINELSDAVQDEMNKSNSWYESAPDIKESDINFRITISGTDKILSSEEWTKENVKVSISTTLSGYTVQYALKNPRSDKSWQDYSTPIEFKQNGVVYARLKENASGQATKYATAKVDNIDKNSPQEAVIRVAEQEAISENVSVKVTLSDKEGESGIDYANSKWVINANNTPLGVIDSSYSGGTFGSNSIPQTQIKSNRQTVEGKYLHILSVDKAGNKRETISGTLKVEFSVELAEKISKIGSYVDYGLDINNNGTTNDDWRVFYIGGINEDDPEETKGRIYIIAADYVPNTNSAIQEVLDKKVIEQYTKTGESWHTYYWSNASKIPAFDYIDTKTSGQNIFPELFMGTGYYCSKHKDKLNAKAVGVLQNASNWQPFISNSIKSGFADKAIGGPTLEMWVKSWNAKHGKNSNDASKKELYFKGEDKNSPGTDTGYYIGADTNPTSKYIYVNSTTGYDDTLYFPHKKGPNLKLDNVGSDDDTCYGYWLASPSANFSNSLMYVGCDGNVGNEAYLFSYGLRPLVSLQLGASLQETNQTVNDTNGTSCKLFNLQLLHIEDKIGKVLDKNNNTTLCDEYDNPIVIPAGFAIVPNGKNNVEYNYTKNGIPSVQDGIVVEDEEGNQFVWIPVGTIKNSDGSTTEITLGRYTFGNDGTPSSPKTDGTTIDTYYIEESKNSTGLSSYGNAIAKDIEEFKTSANTKGGYYLARYEASYGGENKPLSKPSKGTPETQEGTAYAPKTVGQLWNNISQLQASTAAKNMYTGKPYGSDLVNSYAWDTAIVFIQKCSGDNDYSRQNGQIFSSRLRNTGAGTGNDGYKMDKVCNIYDMASNCYEWTTETYVGGDSHPCVIRGDGYASRSGSCTSYRSNNTNLSFNICSFRLTLYITQ